MMDSYVSYHKNPNFFSSLKPRIVHNSFRKSTLNFRTGRFRIKPLTVIAGAGPSHCQFSSLNSPLEPRTPAGKDLSAVLQNHPQLFHLTVADELKQLADDRDEALNRMIRTVGSPEACLHRQSLTRIFSTNVKCCLVILCYLKQIRGG